jgi:hypothetical protein
VPTPASALREKGASVRDELAARFTNHGQPFRTGPFGARVLLRAVGAPKQQRRIHHRCGDDAESLLMLVAAAGARGMKLFSEALSGSGRRFGLIRDKGFVWENADG